MNQHPSRRDLLKTLPIAGAAAVMSRRELLGQFVNKSTAKGGRIDVHHHHQPPGLGIGRGRGRGGPEWTPELSLEQMDKFDIAAAVLSVTQNGDAYYDGTEKGRANVRKANDYGAKLMADHPKRFGLFAAVPLPDLDGSLKELEYGLDTLKADGIGIYTNDNHTRWPGDAYFDPMWQELNRRNTIVYMHPLAPQCCNNLNDGVPTAMNEYDFDVTRAATSLLAGGVLHKYPEIRFIIPHSGGTMPVLAGRIKDRYPNDPKHAEYIPNGVYAELKKFYFDIAHASFPMPLAALLKFAPSDHILFGTDFSPEPIESTVNELPSSGIPPALMRAIERGNAEKLFPRFKV
jgi:predicted TIM-barrel fold metal-dependent hydrolase